VALFLVLVLVVVILAAAPLTIVLGAYRTDWGRWRAISSRRTWTGAASSEDSA